jgi:hypothetical protein
MSSRQEEKEQRRKEREAAEAAFAASQRRKRMGGLAIGGGLVVAAIAAVVVVLVAGGSDKKGPTTKPGKGTVAIPAQKLTDVKAAAAAAGCTLKSFSGLSQQHTSSPVKYPQNPPVGGPHFPAPASDGDYAGQGTPQVTHLVHALEHGRIIVWYAKGTPARRVQQLETLHNEPFNGKPTAYKLLLVEDPDTMPFAVAATAWGQQLGCKTVTDKTFDALRAFRSTYVDKAPEASIPFPE